MIQKRRKSSWRTEKPEALKKLIEAMKKSHATPEYRKRMSLKMKSFYSKHPEFRKKLSSIRKLLYLQKPEYRKKTSLAMKRVFIEHPNLKKEFKENFHKFLQANPEFLKKLETSKGNPNIADVKTLKGGKVRSSYEKKVADTLFMNKINYDYEARVLIFKKEVKWAIPDFWLPDYNMLIEVFGEYEGSKKIAAEVRAKTRWKKMIYAKYGIPLIALTPSAILDLKANLLDKLKVKNPHLPEKALRILRPLRGI
jgi:hypothetical protein